MLEVVWKDTRGQRIRWRRSLCSISVGERRIGLLCSTLSAATRLLDTSMYALAVELASMRAESRVCLELDQNLKC